MNKYPDGVYYIHLLTGKGTISKQIIMEKICLIITYYRMALNINRKMDACIKLFIPALLCLLTSFNLAGQNIINTYPAPYQSDFPLLDSVSIYFSSPVTNASIELHDESMGPVPGTITGNGTSVINFNPSDSLIAGETYRLLIKNNNILIGDIQFTTKAKSGPNFLKEFPVQSTERAQVIKIADVNQDGLPDIISSGYNKAIVGINNGNYSFTNIDIPLPNIPTQIDYDYSSNHLIFLISNSQINCYVYDTGGTVIPDSSLFFPAKSFILVDADFDGTKDLFFVDTSGVLKLWLNYQDTILGTVLLLDSLPLITHMFWADMNNDYIPDLIVNQENTSVLFVMANNLDSSFSISDTITGNFYPSFFEILDLDKDSVPDVLWSNNQVGQIELWQNLSGTFTPIQSWSINHRDVSMHDIDGDGFPDLIYNNTFSNYFGIYLNDSLQFTNMNNLPTPFGFYDFDAFDFNMDGTLDFVTGEYNVNGYRLLIRENPIIEIIPDDYLCTGNRFEVAYFSDTKFGTGNLISVYLSTDSDTINLNQLAGYKNSTYASGKIYCYLPDSISLNMDMLFMVITNPSVVYEIDSIEVRKCPEVIQITPENFTILASQNSEITVTFDKQIDIGTINNSTVYLESEQRGMFPFTVTQIDTNEIRISPGKSFIGNEKITLVLTNAVSDSAGSGIPGGYTSQFMVRSSGNTCTYINHYINIVQYVTYIKGAIVADFNNDDLLDLLIEEFWTLDMVVNQGSGNFSLLNQNLGWYYINGGQATGDFNKDGDIDYILGVHNDGDVKIYDNKFPQINFQLEATLSFIYNIKNVGTGDFDNDGDIDFVALQSTTGATSAVIMENYGTGQFTNGKSFSLSGYSIVRGKKNLDIADFNDDGKLDIAVYTEGGPDRLSIIMSDSINIWHMVQESGLYQYIGMKSVDIDNDKKIDIVLMLDTSLHIMHNDGNEVFIINDTIPLDYEQDMIEFADFNADGLIDFCTTYSSGLPSRLRIYHQDTNGVFTLANSLVIGSNPVAINVGDFDSDGDMDIIVTYNTNSITYYENTGINVAQFANICQGDSIFFGGAYQNTTGIYYDSLTSTTGCDSVIATTLTVNPTYDTVITSSICSSDSIFLAGAYQNTAGTYYDAFLSVDGCDSAVTTILTINSVYLVSASAIICSNDSILLGGTYENTTGTYYDTLISVTSCDSIIATSLIVDLAYTINTPDFTICAGDSVLIFGIYHKIAGTYYDSLTANNGCDSIIATNLSVNPTNFSNPDETICDGDSILIFNIYHKAAGTYYDSLTAANGCDSVIAITLTVNQTYNTTATTAICSNDSIFLQGNYQTTAGVYYDTLASVNGCDSIVTTILTVNQVYSISDPTVDICTGDSALIYGTYRTAAGTYYDSLTTISGCDSIHSTALIVDPLPPVTFTNLDTAYCTTDALVTLAPTPAGGSFSGTGISGNQFDPAVAGTGTHTITYSYTDSNNCTGSVSQNVNVNICSGVEDIEFINHFEIYPNPNTGELTIEFNITRTENLKLKITNTLGQEIFAEKLGPIKGRFIKRLNFQKYPSGIYTFQLVSDKGVITRRVGIE